MKKIVAIGGYTDSKSSFESTQEIDQEIVRLSGKKKPIALFIPTASLDSEKYCQKFLQFYGQDLGCQTDTLLLYKKRPSSKEIKRKIMSADIIYVGGGNTLRMMKFWRKLGVDVLLKQAYKTGKVLCGTSAGAICWFHYGVSDSRQFKNPASKEYIRVQGLNLVDILFCPHLHSKKLDGGYRAQGLKTISAKTAGPAIALEDGAAIVMVDDNFKIISSDGKAKAYQAFWNEEKYHCEEIKVHPQLIPLQNLD